jgi:hypothetical protein
MLYGDIYNGFKPGFADNSNGYGIVWGTNKFVVVSSTGLMRTSTIAYSLDGITWQNISPDPFSGGTGYSIDWNGKIFVAVGSGTNSIAYSYDGLNWTGIGTSIFTVGTKVKWMGNKWLAVGTGTNMMANSYDGVNWYVSSGFAGITGCFTTCTGIGSNSLIGIPVVDSQMTLSNINIPQTKTLDIVSDSYYDKSYTNFTSTFKSYDL